MLEGYKTWSGIALIIIGYLDLSKYVAPEQIEGITQALFVIVGIAFSIYGNYKSHQKIKELS
jgi:hypothetical protein